MHGLSVVRRWASTEKSQRWLVGRLSRPVYTRLVWERQCSRASLRRCTHGAAGAFHVRGRAASAKACARRTWHVGIRGVPRPGAGSISQGLRASDVARVKRGGSASGDGRHWPRPACVGRGVWASGKRSRQTSGGISQGLHASDVACAHRESDVGQPHIAKPTSAVPCAHRSADVGRGLLASLSRRRPWPACIAQSTSSVAFPHRSGDVGRGQPASAVACTQRSAEVERRLPASAVACTQRSAEVERRLPASAVACTQRPADVCRGLAASPLQISEKIKI